MLRKVSYASGQQVEQCRKGKKSQHKKVVLLPRVIHKRAELPSRKGLHGRCSK